MIEPLVLILAAFGGYAFDDWCPTPPRPWPWPGPWPWFRKLLAVLGGIGGCFLFEDMVTDALTTIVIGGISGVVVASLGAGFGLGAGGVRAGDQRVG